MSAVTLIKLANKSTTSPLWPAGSGVENMKPGSDRSSSDRIPHNRRSMLVASSAELEIRQLG
jgi:hypothetical protein